MDEAHAAEYAAEKVADLDKFIAAGTWDKAFEECRYLGEKPAAALVTACEKVYADGIPKLLEAGGEAAKDVVSACRYSEELKAQSEGFKKACDGVMGAEYEAKKKLALEARDQALDDYTRCYDLQSAAEGVSEQAKKDAEVLCAEITAAQSTKKALEEAKATIAAKKSDISYYCKSAAEELTKIEPKSEWTQKTLDGLLQTCFIDLGKVILEVELPNLSYCGYSLTELRAAVATYKLAGKDAAFDAELAKTDKVCATAPN
jgi:hypothetical protein